MSPEEKTALEEKAAQAGSSAGELVRRAVAAYEIGSQEQAEKLRVLPSVHVGSGDRFHIQPNHHAFQP